MTPPWQHYKDQFDSLITFIGDNLDQTFTLEQLSTRAAVSPFHFHRLFSAYTGIPVMQFLTQMKLRRAAYQLKFTMDDILTIALDAGYETPEGFSRAFKKMTGDSPRAYRSNQTPLPDLNTHYHRNRHKHMNYTVDIIKTAALNIAIKEHKGAEQLIPLTIKSFIKWRRENKLSPERSRTFNIYYQDPKSCPPDEYRMDIACEIPTGIKINEKSMRDHSIQRAEIPALTCAKLRHKGPWDHLEAPIRYLYNQWIADNNIELDDYPLFVERVNLYPEVADHQLITDIYLPIKA